MTTASLTDRYVYAAARTVPEAQRAEVERELRERIGDETDALIETGHAPDEAERAALTELGDPLVVAADYVDRPLRLIGPRYYPMWLRLLKLLYAIVLPIAAGGVLLGQIISGAPIGAAIGTTVVTAIQVTVNIGFWTTLVFAVLERTTSGHDLTLTWTPDQLPELPHPTSGNRSNRLSELIGSLVFLGLFAVALVVQQFGMAFRGGPDGGAVPVLNPELWSFWIPFFLALIALEILFAVAVYAWGWNWWLVAGNLALNVAFTVPALWLLLTGQLFSDAFIELIRWPWGDAGPIVIAFVVVATIGVAIWDVVDGAIKAYRASRARTRTA
ncbi:permease prefix domain 1-containing protein [Agromyces silvae]|uniref:permease prefix domain 1-containing protein n=1 Tax=Agromyces silvae TaxID=3388266 RepID=UPI00280A8DA1|nr:permease prefix domain 1-containing protein [Agromyces protaetiae]